MAISVKTETAIFDRLTDEKLRYMRDLRQSDIFDRFSDDNQMIICTINEKTEINDI